MAAAEWYNPKYAAKQVLTHMIVANENVKKDSESTVIKFSMAQSHTVEEVENPWVIWDSGLTIVLAKKKSMIEDIKKCKVTMCSNGGKRSIEEEGY